MAGDVTAAALLEAAAEGMAARNGVTLADITPDSRADTIDHARAALAAMLRAAGVDRQALLNDAAHLDLSVANRRLRANATWGTDPVRTAQMARTAALLRALAEVADG